MVKQILDLVTLHPSNCSGESYAAQRDPGDRMSNDCIAAPSYVSQLDDDEQDQAMVLVPASELHEGQQVFYNGTLLKVRRVVPAFTRSQACHIHLVPLNWQPLAGVNQQLADRDEATVLVRIACPTRKPFQVVA